MHPNTRGLAFLLSLGGLPLGCFKDEMTGDGTTSGGTGTGDGTAGTTGPGSSDDGSSGEPTAGLADSSSSSTAASTGETDTSTGGATSTGSGETTGGAESTGSTGAGLPGDPQCVAYAERYALCIPRYAGDELAIIAYCEMAKQNGMLLDGPACVDALEAFYVCFASTSCADFDPRGTGPCPAAAMTTVAACPNSFGG